MQIESDYIFRKSQWFILWMQRINVLVGVTFWRVRILDSLVKSDLSNIVVTFRLLNIM